MDTTEILNFLYERGYQVSAKKAQISLIQVKYLGFIITEGKRMLDPQRKSLILNTPCPQTRKQLLGITGVCQIWIPIYGNLARPLYEKLKGKEGPLDWDKTCKVAFNTLKEAVTIAPALSLLNLEKPFRLYVSNGWEPLWGCWDKWWGLYYSLWLLKQLDEVAKGWPACLWAVAAAALMVKESSKWALGQPTTVHTP